MSGLQEKFQVILPPQPDEDDGAEWKTFESQRRTYQYGARHVNNTTATQDVDGKFNEMPPNMDLQNQNSMTRSIAGSTDFSADANPEALALGYKRQAMSGSDDAYTGEHADHFYGVAYGRDEKDKLVEGFCERANYLDRL